MLEHDKTAPFRRLQPRAWWAWTQVLGSVALMGAFLSWGLKEANKQAQANHAKALANQQSDFASQNITNVPPAVLKDFSSKTH